MRNLEDIKKAISKYKLKIRTDFRVKKIGVFGSYVRGEQRKNSDVDLLVEFESSPDFFSFLELENYLASILGLKVDLVTKAALKPKIGKHILAEVEYL